MKWQDHDAGMTEQTFSVREEISYINASVDMYMYIYVYIYIYKQVLFQVQEQISFNIVLSS